jgi:hypothetical protein
VNAASATGFDIQFPAVVGGLPGNHRYHLDEQSLELLHDKQRCGVLHPDIIIKLIAPNLVFKRRTSDGPEGGEQYLPSHPDNIVVFADENGHHKQIDLSQPVNFLHITAPELTAIFNHPGIRRESKSSPARHASSMGDNPTAGSRLSPSETAPKAQGLQSAPPPARVGVATSNVCPDRGCVSPTPDQPQRVAAENAFGINTQAASEQTATKPSQTAKLLPNLWLKDALSKSPVRHEWLAPLAYRKMARHFDNSSEGSFGAIPCWFISLNGTADINDPEFKGIFLTEKGGLGFLSKGQVARFNNGAACLGKVDSTREGIGIDLVALGVNAQSQVAFVLADNYRSKFKLAEPMVIELQNQLNESGAVIMSISELLSNRDPLEHIWTLPVEQPDPDNPQVLELKRPDSQLT